MFVPDGVQHAGCDALSPGQTEDPDPTDAAQSLFWDGGAAPGSVSLHEVVLHHVFVPVRLLEDSVSLKGREVDRHKATFTVTLLYIRHLQSDRLTLHRERQGFCFVVLMQREKMQQIVHIEM